MKNKDNKLTIEEIETLCNLYIECKLSVLEETELYYVLIKTDKDSALINETKAIMGIERKIADSKPIIISKKPFYKRFAFYGAAACLALVIAFTGVISKFGEQTAPKTPLLTQKATEKNYVKSIEKTDERSQIDPETKPGKEVPVNSVNIVSSKGITAYDHKHEKIDPKEPMTEVNVEEDYIEIIDENEAAAILQEIDEKLTAILEKGSNINYEIPDIKEKMDNIIKRYEL